MGGDAESVSEGKDPRSMNFRQKVAVAVADVVVIVELVISVTFARQNPGDFAAVFLMTFFSLLAPTLILAGFVIKGLRSKATGPENPA